MRRMRQLATSLQELRLPKPERAAARAERAVEARMRLERDYVHHADRMRAAAAAERRRWGFIGGWDF